MHNEVEYLLSEWHSWFKGIERKHAYKKYSADA